MKKFNKFKSLMLLLAICLSGFLNLGNLVANQANASAASATSTDITPVNEYTNGWTYVGSHVTTAGENDGSFSYYPYTYPAGSNGYYVSVFHSPSTFTSDYSVYKAVLTVRWYNYGAERFSMQFLIDGHWPLMVNNVQPSSTPGTWKVAQFTFDALHWSKSTLDNLKVKIWNSHQSGNTAGVDFLKFTLYYERDVSIASHTESLNSWVHSGSNSGTSSSVSVQNDNYFAYHPWTDKTSGNYLQANFQNSPNLNSLSGYSITFVQLIITIYSYSNNYVDLSIYLNGAWQNLGYNPFYPGTQAPPFVTWVLPLTSESPHFTYKSISDLEVKVNAALGNTIGVDYIGLKVSVRPQFTSNSYWDSKPNFFYNSGKDDLTVTYGSYMTNLDNSAGAFTKTSGIVMNFGFEAQINPDVEVPIHQVGFSSSSSKYYISSVTMKLYIITPTGSYLSGSNIASTGSTHYGVTDYSKSSSNLDPDLMAKLYGMAIDLLLESAGVPGSGYMSSAVEYIMSSGNNGISFTQSVQSDGVLLTMTAPFSATGNTLNQVGLKLVVSPEWTNNFGTYSIGLDYSVNVHYQTCTFSGYGVGCVDDSNMAFTTTYHDFYRLTD